MVEKFVTNEEYGEDFILDIDEPGKYEIPVLYYDYESDDDTLDDDFEKLVEVEVTRVVKPPVSRYMLVIGYDENGKSQMWYYTDSEDCFKRIWQGGFMGNKKTLKHVMSVLQEDAEINEEELAKELANHFMSL